MADIYQSSLFEPTAPPEHMLHKPVIKKQAKIVSGLGRSAKDKKPPPAASSRSSHTLSPFLEYFTKQRKNNNNNNNNINNYTNKVSHAHSFKNRETRGSRPNPKAENGIKRFSFFRGKQTTCRSPKTESTGNHFTSEKEETIVPHITEGDRRQVEDATPQAREAVEVVCHGLAAKTDSLGQACLLSQANHETNWDADFGLQKDIDCGVLPVTNGKGNGKAFLKENEEEWKQNRFVDKSETQEQLNVINMKRCKDAMMPQSLGWSSKLPAHSESLSIPPVIEETEENNVEEPPVIEVFLPQREPSPKQPPSTESEQGVDDKAETHNNVKKRRKLRHILRHFLSMNNSIVKEDKQRLVDDDEDDDEEEQVTVEPALDGQEGHANNKDSSTKTPQSQDDTDAASPEKKRRPGAKGHCRGWGRRIRRSMGRGCHYLGLSVVNITTYMIAEANFMSPMFSTTNYDGEFIHGYTTNEYGISDFIYYS